MAKHNELGKLGEELAVAFLKENGYEIIDTNWRFQKAEIDIVAKKVDTLAIIEVKSRSSADFGLPQDFVNSKKIQHLIRAADEYVRQKNTDSKIRFDIIAILKQGKDNFSIEHIEDAFYYF
ncbi:MAG TPA: YraN family protein [Flavobacterium sp.]|nr:YraN family protein [Flavobacterium sp.]